MPKKPYKHTEAERRIKVAIASMPGGGAYERIRAAGIRVGSRYTLSAPIELEDVATYLEALLEVRIEQVAEIDRDRKRLAQLESDLAAVARIFGGGK